MDTSARLLDKHLKEKQTQLYEERSKGIELTGWLFERVSSGEMAEQTSSILYYNL